jgi:uncharacterized protein YcfJ
MSQDTRTTLTGAGLGAGAGAIVGSFSGNAGMGALIGGAVGTAGGLIFNEVRHGNQRAYDRGVQSGQGQAR